MHLKLKLASELDFLGIPQGKLDLLSVAFKNAVGERRASWRVMKNIVEQCTGKDRTDQEDEVKKDEARKDEGSEVKRELAKEYMDVLNKEITNICEDLLVILSLYIKGNNYFSCKRVIIVFCSSIDVH